MGSTTFPNSTIYDLPSFDMIGGTDQELTFAVYTSGCVTQSLNGATVTWNLAHLGSSIASVSKTVSCSGSSNQFTIKLNAGDTSGSQGDFIHQYTIVDSTGSYIKPSMGKIFMKLGY